MKLLFEKKCIYLLLLEIILSLFTTIIGYDSNNLQKNIIYISVNFFIKVFIYYNVSKINNKLKIASFFILFNTIINIVITLILDMYNPIIIFNISLSDCLKIISSILGIPIAFFFYKGFEEFISEKTKSIILAYKFKKLIFPNIVACLLNLMLQIINLYGDPKIFPEIIEVQLLLLLGFSAFAIYLEILKIINLFKTAKELNSIR